jgi:subtilisin family serine protease
MKRVLAVLFVLLLAQTTFAGGVHRYLIATRDAPKRAMPEVLGELPEGGDRAVEPFVIVQAFAADLTDDEAATLKHSPQVRFIELDAERHALSDSVTPGAQTTPYGVTMVDAPQVWPVTRGMAVDHSARIHVVVLDTGIDYDDPELKVAYKGGWNTLTNTPDPRDDNGHGSHVAGTIAAADNGIGVVGVAPDVALYSVKVLDQCGSGSVSGIINGVQWVIDQKVAIGGNWIMSLSLGSDTSSPLEQEAFQKAADAGILTFAAAGNSYDPTAPVDGLSYPAAYPTVLSVGAIDSSGNIASFSQRGIDLKFVAPGVDVLSTFVSEGVTTNDGRTFLGTLPAAKNATGDAWCLTRPTLTGSYIYSGIGNPADFPAAVAGKIALIQRGTLKFIDKVKNAQAAGARGVMLYNNTSGLITPDFGILSSPTDVLPTVFLSQADGESLKSTPDATVTTSFGLKGYANLDGTSMATPHASAAAALVWAVAPSAPASSIRNALLTTAQDLGAPGQDTVYGYGLIDAYAAAKSTAPQLFVPPAQTAPSGRRILKRGHA